MKQMNVTKCIVNCIRAMVVFSLLIPAISFAAPQTINFQGVLKDSSDNLINNSSLSMTFRIFNVVTAGSHLWTETHAVNVIEGNYSVILGSATPLTPTLFLTDNLWVEITVGSDILTPRQKLSSVAYSLSAVSTLSPSSVTSSHIVDGTITTIDLSFTPLATPYSGTIQATNFEATGDVDATDDLSCDDDLTVGDNAEIKDGLTVGANDGSDGDVWVKDSSGTTKVHIDSSYNDGGTVRIFHDDGSNIVGIGENNNGGNINIQNDSNYTTVQLIGNYSGGNGRINVNGSEVNDYAEYFDLTNSENILPGMLVSIDPDNIGALKLSVEVYDKKVAGIISGAGDMMAGMIIGDSDEENKNKPLSVSGMVYCYVDASEYSVEVGDLLTSSKTPGYAMKAVDMGRSFGAVVGKAMEPLPEGKSLILVLVTLQ